MLSLVHNIGAIPMDSFNTKPQRGKSMKKLLGLFIITVLTLVGCSQSKEKQDVVKVG